MNIEINKSSAKLFFNSFLDKNREDSYMSVLGKVRIARNPFLLIYRFPVLFIILLCIVYAILFMPFYSRAQEQVPQHFFDDAKYFSEDKAEKLESLCLEYGEMVNANIVMLIEDGIKSGAWKGFMEDFYDSNSDELGNCALLLLDVNKKERRIEIQGYGEMEYIITDSRIEHIIDSIFDDLKAGKYYCALAAFPVLVKQYYDNGYGEDARTHTERDNETYDPYYYKKRNATPYFIICIPIALVMGGIFTGVMVVHSGGKTTANFRNYMDGNRKSLIGRYDRYTHTTTSKRRKPQQNSSHGGGGGGVSHGGSSHSGGGRSF